VRAGLSRAWLELRHRRLGRRYGHLVLEWIDGVPLLVLPDVFNPVLFRGGKLLAHTLRDHSLLTTPGLRVLDLGCGSGVVAVFAARRGAHVVATDINPAAVQCTRINALLNRVEAQVETAVGDLFEPVAGRVFDLIVFNPPFFRGRPRDPLDHAWRGEDVFERFAAGLDRHLAAGGQAWVLLSTDGAGAELLSLLAGQGFRLSIVNQRRWWNEIMTVYGVER
jgi:HemK-related putative methylase